jgi:hypothetical protein
MCVQEEERLKSSQGDSVNHVHWLSGTIALTRKGVNHVHWLSGTIKRTLTTRTLNHKENLSGTIAPPLSHKERPHKLITIKNSTMFKYTRIPAKWCKRKGHYQKECLEFLKHMMRKCEDVITFIDESLYLSYAKSTWWIDSGATIYVANLLQGFHTRRTLQRRERHIKVANGVKAEVKAIGQLPLELNDDFVLKIIDVFYVPSLHRNLISV